MERQESSVAVLEAPPTRPAATTGLGRRLGNLVGHVLPTVLALGCIAGLVFLGQRTGWSLPKFSALQGADGPEKEDWCAEHSVPESVCVECKKDLMPRGKAFGWCDQHGVHECPLEHPEVAQTPSPARVTAADRRRAEAALAFAPRAKNNSRCKLHERRLQFTSEEVMRRLGVTVAAVTRAAVAESVSAPGEIGYDPTRVARLSARVAGTVWSVQKQLGDRVYRGEVLALVEAADVGKAKVEFQEALTQANLKTLTLARLQQLAGESVSRQSVQSAAAAVEEARVRLLTAELALANLDLPFTAQEAHGLSPAEMAARMQFLGLPQGLVEKIAGRTRSNNLIAVAAPFDGEVVSRTAVAGEAADPARPLFVVADTTRMWLTLRVRTEDADKVRAGQKVHFRHEGHPEADDGVVAWVSPAADEKSRAVPVRVALPNPAGRHHANTFGTAEVILRVEPRAIVVPSEAVHWEGDCHVVFIRDKNFARPGAAKVFHVRTVRPGAQTVVADVPMTEIIAGVLPGEGVAAANSGFLRSELLKNNLGEG